LCSFTPGLKLAGQSGPVVVVNVDDESGLAALKCVFPDPHS
jgi:hypothetical protein